MEQEIWLPVNGFEGLYEISNYGQVKSCDKRRGTNYSCFIPAKIMASSDNGSGYRNVGFSKNSKQYTKYVHILVAQHFIPNPENKPEVNHKDGDKNNNRSDNLNWSTRKENEEHAWSTGLKKMIGKGHFASKPIIQMDLEGREINRWDNSGDAERSLGLPSGSTHIRDCCLGKLQTSLGFKWKYAI